MNVGPIPQNPFSSFNLKGFPKFSPFTFKDPAPEPLVAALASILTSPGGQILTQAIEQAAGQVVQAVAEDPKGAAKLLREATQVTFPLIEEAAKIDRQSDGSKTVGETITTVRTERGPNYSKITTTKTTTKERITDPVKQQEKLKQGLEVVQGLVNGLEGGEVRLGNASVPFSQVQELFASILRFLEKGKSTEAPFEFNIGGNEDNGNDKTQPSS